jgi:hypothetical protein
LEGVPFCIVKEIESFKNFIGEFRDGTGKIREGEIREKKMNAQVEFRREITYSEQRKAILRKKANFCKICIYDSLCEGPWKSYAEIYGFKEFKPIKSG